MEQERKTWFKSMIVKNVVIYIGIFIDLFTQRTDVYSTLFSTLVWLPGIFYLYYKYAYKERKTALLTWSLAIRFICFICFSMLLLLMIFIGLGVGEQLFDQEFINDLADVGITIFSFIGFLILLGVDVWYFITTFKYRQKLVELKEQSE